MSSPFSSAKEFLEAKGPIYTFANNPTAIAILLILSLAITIYFIYASYNMKREDSGSKNPAMMSILLVAGLAASLTGFLSGQQKPTTEARTRYEQRSQRQIQPMAALLGLMGGVSMTRQLQPRSLRKLPRQQRF